MSFHWEEELEPEAAEFWLGENFEELSDYGIAAVSLFEDDDLVYGPMGLGKQE